ncbi:RE2 [Symbiodinium natans]|uniref:RE2 protein n=1 Tax=Symbiodinium natans TaxID=878477 RepID=A0A812NGT7_9DINO|nr:RE2 [Symbiodinium natans]
MKSAAVEVVRLCQLLGHTEVELRCDQEPSMLQLQGLAMNARKRLGFKTRIRNPPVGAHQANGCVEKAVDVIRGLANVMLSMCREKLGVEIPVNHPLFGWSFLHASWTYSRFKVKGGLTAYERCTGSRYNGKLVPFGEPVYAYVRPSQKGNPRWSMSMFLSKSPVNDMFIVGTANGVMLTKSVRRTGQPWALEAKLANEVKGMPWDYSLGTLGTKTVPQAKARAPNAVAAPLVPPIPELMPPPGGLPRQAKTAHNEPIIPEVVPQIQPASVTSSVPGSRKTLLLDRDDSRASVTPVSPIVPALPGPATSSSTEPNLLPDSSMLSELLPKRSAGQELGGDAASSQPAKVPRIRRVLDEEFAVNDEETEQAEEWSDPKVHGEWIDDVYEEGQSHEVLSDEPESGIAGALSKQKLKDLESRLWFPVEPDLDADELRALDAISDEYEVQRLIRKGVLRQSNVKGQSREPDVKRLSTKFVRTWRSKTKDGVPMVLRRSRLCAREYRWLEMDREDIFAPATNAAVTRLLPWLFASKRKVSEGEYGMLVLDVKDAYLTVPQGERVIASMPSDYASEFEYEFDRCIPGQRDGAIKWHLHFLSFVRKHLKVTVCPACPALWIVEDSKLLIHVDDMFIVGKISFLRDRFLPLIESEFEVTWTLAAHEGESVNFLKRKHLITSEGVVIQSQSDLFHKLCKVVDVGPKKTSRTPCTKELLKPSDSPLLDAEHASRFRTAIGIAMYCSADRGDCAFVIRSLAQRLREPTQADWRAVQKLASYLRGTEGYAIHLVPQHVGASVLHRGYGNDECQGHLLEAFSDADWSGLCNPSDISTKVLSEKRLKGLLGAQNVVDMSNSMESVGEHEWHEILEEVATNVHLRKVSKQFRSKCVKSKAFVRIAVMSLMLAGCDAAEATESSSPWIVVTDHSNMWKWYMLVAFCLGMVAVCFQTTSLELWHRNEEQNKQKIEWTWFSAVNGVSARMWYTFSALDSLPLESATDSSLSWDWAPVPRAPPFQPVRILPRRFHLQLLQRRAGAAPHLFSYVLEASFAGVLISTSEGSRIFLFLTEADWRAVATAGHRSHACARQLLGLSA